MVKKKKKKKKPKTSVLLMWVFPGGSAVKNLSSRQETWIQSLGWEDPLEREMATHSSILAWPGEFHRRRSLTGYSPWGRKKSDTTEQLTFHFQ